MGSEKVELVRGKDTPAKKRKFLIRTPAKKLSRWFCFTTVLSHWQGTKVANGEAQHTI